MNDLCVDSSFYSGFNCLLKVTGRSYGVVFVLVVLSSDEEEGVKSCDDLQRCSQMVHSQASIGDAGTSPGEAKREEEASDSEDTEVGMCSFST